MGKDVKKRFTVSLDIETKDVEKQVKATVGNLKTILADLGKASDKMGYFKELVDYIGQIDTALTALRAKNKNAFGHMFDGLDADLKKAMEGIFDTSSKTMSALDALRGKLNDASKNGAGVKELRQIAAEINDLFTSLGRAEPIDIDAQFSGRGKTEDRIKILTDALDNFATVWDGVNNKVKSGFGFGDAGGIVEFSEEVQKEIDALEDKIKSIQNLMTELQNVFKMTKAFNDGKDVALGFEATEDAAKNLLEQFKLLSVTRQKFLEDGDTSSPAYYENLIQYTKAATQLVALNDELAKSSKGSPKFLANALSGEFVDVYDFIESFDKKFVSGIQTSLSKIVSDAQTSIDKIKADALKNVSKNAGQGAGAFDGSGSTADDEITKNKALVGSYEELSNKINEYYNILQRRKKFDEDSEEFTDLSFRLDGIADYIEKIKSLSLEEKLELNDIFGDLTYEEYGPEEALKRICNILQVEIPSAAKTAKKSLDGFGESTDGVTGGSNGGSGGTITNVDFTSLENTIKAEIASIANKLDSVFKVEVVKNDTEDIKNAIDGVKSTIEKISAEIDSYNTLKKTDAHQAEVNAMKNNLTQLFKFVSEFNNKQLNGQYQDQEISAAILSDGSITTGYGEDGTVPWDRMASALVSNLTKSLMVDIHSHPWAQNAFLDRYANDSFSGSKGDLGAFRFSKELGAQMAAMITGNIMRTLDISKLTDEQMMQFRKALAQIEKTKANTPEYSKYMEYKNDKLYYHSQPTLDEQHKVTEAFESLMYEAFKQIGLSKDKVDKEIFKKYDLTDDAQLTKLAEHLVHLSQSSQNALSPVERLSEIISHFGGDVNSKTAKENFEAFTKGELTAAEVFNNLNRDGHTLNQETLDSLYKIDSANEMPVIESLLTQVVSALNAIESSVVNINNNTRHSTRDQFDTAINDILDIREGVNNKNILAGIKSIFDPLNISEYKNNEVLQIADGSILDAKDYIQDLFVKSHSEGSVSLDEMQIALDKFYLAMSNIQDAIKQVDLYEERTGKTHIDNAGDIAKFTLNDKYKEITDDNLLQQLLYLLSQAKVDISKSKEFYQGGFSGNQSDLDYDNGQVSSALQSIKATLDSIYGVLHGFTGIEADNKNALKYKEPVVDTSINRKEFSEQDISVLNSILQVLQGIDVNLSTNKSDDVSEKVTKDNTDISDLVSFIKSKLSNQIATEDTLQAIKGAIEQVAELARSKDETKKDDSADLTQSLNTLISALTANVTTLKDVANGIVQHQKAQKSDTSKAMARIQDPTEQQIISGIAKDSVIDLGTEVEIESLQALANGLVKVEGAFKNANGQWEGFAVKVNEANAAVDLAIKKQSAFAKALNKAKDIDENTYQYNKEEVEARAQKHLEEYAAQGKNATVQFKDSGRYTITILEEIDGLSKQIFQTFDENDKKIERTTVTMSNSQKLKLENLQKKLIDNGLTNGLISDKDNEYKNYQAAADALSNMTNAYSQMDNISDVEIANWKQQIALVQQLGNQVSDLIKQRKLANDQKVFESDISKKLSKFYLDKATLQKDIAIPDSFNQQIGDARTAIENAIDADSLKIAINNWEALQNKIKKTAVEQDLYNKKAKEPKQKVDEFTKNLSKQTTDFAKYKTDIQNALGVTDELREKLNGLETDLSAIGDATGLDAWIQRLKSLKTEISNAQKGFKASQIAVSSDIAGKANSKFKELNFKATDNNLTQEQEEIVNKRKELLQQIKEYNIAVNSGQKVEIDGIKEARDELYKLIDAYKTAHNIANVPTRTNKGQAYGLNQLQTFTARYNSLLSGASDVGLGNQAPVVLNLVNAYKQLQVAQSAFVTGEDKTSAVYAKKVEVFKAAQLACNNYARELNRVINSSKKLEAESGGLGSPLDEDFKDDFKGREAALRDFVNTTYGSKAAIEGFDSSFNKLNFTVKNSDGTFTKMTASINEARTAIYATAGATEKVTGKFGRFINELGGKFKSISTYFMASFGIEEVWQQLRQGIQYVREIDSALTELKKVTNETDASYDRFLQSMSKTGSVIGATVQDLTTMAADWARLGYSMQEAGKLAESTAILLNVSEFQDATAASEALISTMQAFQYTADDSKHVVDILNEVGNNYAVSSDGLAVALQDSASALMEGGNNLEQAVALVAAANRVVQDPNSVGGALRTISLRLRGTSVEVLEEMGEETDGVAESASKLQEKLKVLTGVDIVDMNGAYKDTYTILKEIGSVWEDMSDMDKAATLELMAGKNRANTLSAILSNMKDLEGAYDSALNAEGSALRENEAYLDSIQGRIDLFNNSLQTMWMNFLNDEVVKKFVDFGTLLVQLADKFGVLETAAVGFLTYLNLSSNSNFDLASILGIHELEESFIKGFSVFGKEGLTGGIVKSFSKLFEKNKKETIEVPVSIEPEVEQIDMFSDEYMSNIQLNHKLSELHKAQDELKKLKNTKFKDIQIPNDAFEYKNKNAKKAYLNEVLIPNKEAEIQAIEKDISDITNAAKNSIKQNFTELEDGQFKIDFDNIVDAEGIPSTNLNDAFANFGLNVQDKLSGKKIDFSDFETAARQIDGFNAALGHGQEAFLNYLPELNNTDAALQAYLSSLNGGQASLQGFQAFIQQHNASVKASGVAAKAAAVGHQLLNAALSMGISLFISDVISYVMKLANAHREAAEAAKDHASEVKKQTDSLKEYKQQVTDLRHKLDSGNLSEQEAYDIRKQLISIQDELIDRYGKEAEGINVVTGAIKDQKKALDELAISSANDWLTEHSKGSGLFGLGDSAIDQAKEVAEKGYHLFDFGHLYSQSGFKDAFGDGWKEEYNDWRQEYVDFIESLGGEVNTNDSFSFDNVSKLELKDYVDQIAEFLRDYASKRGGGLDLSKLIGQIANEEDRILGSDFETQKANYEAYLENTAIAEYTDQYNEILEAQEKYKEALASGDKETVQSALDGINNAIKEAAQAATDGGDSAISDYFTDMWDAFAQTAAEYDFKEAIENNAADKISGGLRSAMERVKSDMGDLKDQDILQIHEMIEDGADVDDVFVGDYADVEEAYNTLAECAKEYGLEVENLIPLLVELGYLEGTPKVEKVQDATDILSDLANTLDSIQSKYDTLQGAIDEFNECGAISGETLKSLIDNNLLQYLTFTENGLIADANAMKMLEQAAINEAYAMLNAAMVQDMENYALGKTEQLSALAQNAIGLAGSAAANAGAQAAAGAEGFLTFASAVAKAGIIDPGNLTAGLQQIYNAYQNIGNAIGHASAYRPSDANPNKKDKSSSGSSSDSPKEIDWIEHYYTEIENRIDELNARLENKISNVQALDAKNTIIDQIIDLYDQKQQKLANAVATYDARADYLFSTFSSDIQNKINNGSLDISSIKDKELASNIEEYYDYIEAASQARVEAEELKQTIADLAKQKFDNISTAYENEIGLVDDYIEALQDQIDATEARGEQVGTSYYESMIDSAEKRKQSLEEERNALQASLDEAVKLGQVEVGSDTWYEMVDAIYEVDSAIVEAEISMEEWQTAINDLHWENFDKLIGKLENISDELDNIYERLTDNDEAFDENGNWTNQGIAALGMLVQKMEQAQFAAQQYADQIDELNTDYAAGKYSEEEYNEKLAELTEGQWESIEAYEAAKDEIIDLNKARVDAVKDGMQKELDAYKELIDAKKEALEADKKAHDWTNSIAEKEKNIADIQRKLAALASDNSTSANAQKKKLQAELLKAQSELEEAYYDKSIEDQQDALDKEYENYEENQQKEIDSLEEWLDDREQIINDSFDLVRENAEVVYKELLNLSQEYGIEISDEIIAPWLAGKDAIGEYKDAFLNSELNEATSAFMDQLDSVKDKWEETAIAAEEAADRQIAAVKRQQQETIAAYKEMQDSISTITIGNMDNVGYDDSDNGGGGGAGWGGGGLIGGGLTGSTEEEAKPYSVLEMFTDQFGKKLRESYDQFLNDTAADFGDEMSEAFIQNADQHDEVFKLRVPEEYKQFLQLVCDDLDLAATEGVELANTLSKVFATTGIPDEYKVFLANVVEGLGLAQEEGINLSNALSAIFASEEVPQNYKDFLTCIVGNLNEHILDGKDITYGASEEWATSGIPSEYQNFLDSIMQGLQAPVADGTQDANNTSANFFGSGLPGIINGVFYDVESAAAHNGAWAGQEMARSTNSLFDRVVAWWRRLMDSFQFSGGSSTHTSSSGRSHGGGVGGFADGTANANGTAYADGNWGAPKTETSLVGEIGPEILVRNGKWTTVGENGAEFTQVKKGDIIFNHKQSEQLLKHGHVTGRGKAYASGTWKNISSHLDDLGEELTMCAGPNGGLQFLSKGAANMATDTIGSLTNLTQLDPTDILNRSRPSIGVSPSVVNNTMEIKIDASVGELIHVDHLNGNNLDEISKFVDKAWEKKMQTLNNSIKKFTR